MELTSSRENCLKTRHSHHHDPGARAGVGCILIPVLVRDAVLANGANTRANLRSERCELNLRPQPTAAPRRIRIRPRLQIRRLNPQSPPDTHTLARHGHSHDAAPALQPPLRASRRHHHPETRAARRQPARAETAPTWHHSPPHAR